MKNPIAKELKNARKELAEKTYYWKAHKLVLLPIIAKLQQLGVENFAPFSFALYTSFTGDKHMLASVVRVLRTAGFVLDRGQQRPEANSTQWSTQFINPETATRISMYFSSAVCRRVQIGTRTVQEPVYEVRCSDPIEEALA